MITRTLSSATVGVAVTLGLLFLMQLLIASGEEIVTEPRTRYVLEFLGPQEPPDTPVETRLPKKPDKPKLPPETKLANSGEVTSVGVGIPATIPVPRTGRPTLEKFGVSDGPLMNVIKVQPQYPTAAASRGLDGTVIVQFDVTEMGIVENIVVIESSNRIFNKAAINAASRFKYKPEIVDGTPHGAMGLRQLFRFEME